MIRILFFLALLFCTPAFAQEATHGIAMHGAPKYPANFTHLDYTNPDATKGGTLRLWGAETFDTLNNFIPKGVEAEGLGLIYMQLMEGSDDEAFSMYGALAESIETPEDRSWVVFNIRKEAVWHDGKPITADDVAWTFATLREKGNPFYASYYANVKDVKVENDHRIRFTFDMANNRELPLIVGQFPILPKHYWEGRDFTATTLEPPLGAGPYKIGTVVPGRSIEYVRVKDWWAKDLPLYKGRYNFDRITYDYYKDQTVSLEALFANEYDYRQEYTAKLWATAYDAPAVKDKRIVKKIIQNQLPQGMQAFIFNMRRPVFQDREVRRAIDLAFDFEWSNKQFAYDAYTRTRSYFANSEMEAKGLPSAEELAILEKHRGKVPEEVFTAAYNPAKTDGSGKNRENMKKAQDILKAAGYVTGPDKIMHNPKTGQKLEFEFLVSNVNSSFERWFAPYKQNLERLGIKASMRVVDASQYVNRVMAFDYDLVVGSFPQSNSPGNEQREFWGSEKADQPGSRNLIGVKDPVVDELVEQIISAPTREDLIIRCRALDRVLQWGYYAVPNWHIAAWRIAYWDKFGQPDMQAPYALGVADTWWIKP